jgi:hypothetical protein
MTADTSSRLDDFVAFSAVATGFTAFDLAGTGHAEQFLASVDDIVGEAIMGELLAAFRRVSGEPGSDEADVRRGLRREVFSDACLGPVARSLVKLWYVGTWYGLPDEWREAYGESELDRTFVVSPTAYSEGLLWPAIGVNPPGAKALGYGMWATPPTVTS